MALVSALLWILAGVASAGASESSHHDESQPVARAARTGARDVKVPRSLVARVEKDYDAYLQGLGVVNRTPFKRMLINVSADLTAKRPGALHEDARIRTPLGGGVVDLADFVTPVRGSFSAKIFAEQEGGTALENPRVFYVSRAKRRGVGSEFYGAGCDKWMDITSYFKKAMARGGFELYTADQRYLSVIGGTFVLVGFAREAIQVGSITFTDSRYGEVLCDSPQEKNTRHEEVD